MKEQLERELEAAVTAVARLRLDPAACDADRLAEAEQRVDELEERLFRLRELGPS